MRYLLFFVCISIKILAENASTDSLVVLQLQLKSLASILSFDYYTQYSTIFKEFPEHYRALISEYITIENISKDKLEKINSDKSSALRFAFKAIGDINTTKFSVASSQGYTFIGPSLDKQNDLLQGKRIDYSLSKDFNWPRKQLDTLVKELELESKYLSPFERVQKEEQIKERTKRLQEVGEVLVNDYKIHLMPKDDEVISTVITLIDYLQSNEKLRIAIEQFKYKNDLIKKRDSAGNILPKIVIYTSTGKQYAQQALDIIYSL